MRSRGAIGEVAFLSLLLIVSGAIQLALLPSKFVGPDTWKYLQIAHKQWAPGFWGDPSAFDWNYWPIGYPTFVSIVLRIFNDQTLAIQIIHVLLALILIVFAWGLAFHLGRGVRMVVAIGTAAAPAIWGMSRIGGYEILLSVLLCGSLLALWPLSHLETRCPSWVVVVASIASGLSASAAVLVQNKAVVVVPVLIFLAWRVRRYGPLVLTASFVAGLAPWAIRNLVVTNTLNPFNNNGPINVWIGNNPDATTGGFMEPPPLPPGATDFLDASIRFIVSQPEAAFALLLRRLVRLLEPIYVYPESLPGPVLLLLHGYSIVFSIAVTLLFLSFAFGWLWRLGSALPTVAPLAAFVGVYYVVHLPFLAEPRYMSPVTPVAVVVAVATAPALARRRLASRAVVPCGADH